MGRLGPDLEPDSGHGHGLTRVGPLWNNGTVQSPPSLINRQTKYKILNFAFIENL